MKIPIKIIKATSHPKSNLKPAEIDWLDASNKAEDISNIVDLRKLFTKDA